MSNTQHVLLPCQGNPLHTVWLPKNGSLSDLAYEIKLSDDVTRAARRQIKQWGLGDIGPRFVGHVHRNSSLYVLIVWVPAGKTPKGLVEVPIRSARQDHGDELKWAIDHINEMLARSR